MKTETQERLIATSRALLDRWDAYLASPRRPTDAQIKLCHHAMWADLRTALVRAVGDLM